MKFQSRIKLKIKGLNQERTFNNLAKEVKVLKLDRLDKQTADLEIAPRDSKKTKEILKNANFEIISEKKTGYAKILANAKACFGVLIGLAIVMCTYLAQFAFVWQIKIYGLEKLDNGQVLECIESTLPSRFKPQISTQNLEITLKNNFEGISAVSVAIIGQSLVVNVHESELPDEMTSTYQPIISQYDCRITEIELIQGTLVVEIGQIVRKGQVLVQPYIIDSQGQQRHVKPMANIKADVWIEGVSEHKGAYIQRTRTGKKVTQNVVTLFGLAIYTKNSSINFSDYDLVESESMLSKNLMLPFKVKKKIYYEIKSELIESDFESVKQNYIDAAREKALQNIAEYEIIKEESVNIREGVGVNIVSYIITVNREIGG